MHVHVDGNAQHPTPFPFILIMYSAGQELTGTTTTMLLSTQTMVQKHKTDCSNTAFCQGGNRRPHSLVQSVSS